MSVTDYKHSLTDGVNTVEFYANEFDPDGNYENDIYTWESGRSGSGGILGPSSVTKKNLGQKDGTGIINLIALWLERSDTSRLKAWKRAKPATELTFTWYFGSASGSYTVTILDCPFPFGNAGLQNGTISLQIIDD